MRKKISALILASAITIFSCGCEKIILVSGTTSSEESVTVSEEDPVIPSYPVTINDTVIEKQPEKVISLTPSYTEILCEMGYDKTLTAVSEYCDFPESVKALPKAANSTNPDIKKIIELSPDIVITSSPIITKDKVQLEAKGITVLVLPPPTSVQGFQKIYECLGLTMEGILTGADKGESAFNKIKASLLEAEKNEKHKFIYVTASLSPAGGDTIESAILSHYGENCAKNGKGYSFSPAELMENQPEIILLSGDITVNMLQKSKDYSGLDAVKNGKIIVVDNKYFERPTSRITELIAKLNKEIPEKIKEEIKAPEKEESEEENAQSDSDE